MFRAGPEGNYLKILTGPGPFSEIITECNISKLSICRTTYFMGRVRKKSTLSDFWLASQSNWRSISSFRNVGELLLLFWSSRAGPGPGFFFGENPGRPGPAREHHCFLVIIIRRFSLLQLIILKYSAFKCALILLWRVHYEIGSSIGQ